MVTAQMKRAAAAYWSKHGALQGSAMDIVHWFKRCYDVDVTTAWVKREVYPKVKWKGRP